MLHFELDPWGGMAAFAACLFFAEQRESAGQTFEDVREFYFGFAPKPPDNPHLSFRCKLFLFLQPWRYFVIPKGQKASRCLPFPFPAHFCMNQIFVNNLDQPACCLLPPASCHLQETLAL